jgi:hypothetical protein
MVGDGFASVLADPSNVAMDNPIEGSENAPDDIVERRLLM